MLFLLALLIDVNPFGAAQRPRLRHIAVSHSCLAEKRFFLYGYALRACTQRPASHALAMRGLVRST